ncbi:MAG: glycosyltransferase family 39 protein [Thaumarchaeota archaeon]|nr:glycosyltransferase family 39 protein [Nitrososphaerota archaeon]
MPEENSSNINIPNYIGIIERKLNFFTKNTVISIIILCAISLGIRLYYFPYNLPFIQDALVTYFLNANDVSILGHIPTNFPVSNIGWPLILSFFFTLFHSNTFMDYVTLQRSISMAFSVFTIIPVYFLCKRFFDKPYAIVGAAIFAFEPHIIQNSLLGITEPLYIFLVSSGLALYFSSKDKIVFSSFVIVGLSTLVRAEGLFVFSPLVIMYFIRNRKEQHVIKKGLLIIAIFALVLFSAYVIKIATHENDQIIGRVLGSTNQIVGTSSQEGFIHYFAQTTKNFIEFSGWSLIPVFVFFLPIGVFLLFRNRNMNNITIIVTVSSMLLPVYYAYSVAPDTRYIYPLFPLFCIISIFTIKKIESKISNRNILFIMLLGIILFSSLVFLDLKKPNYEQEREAFKISSIVTNIAKGVNSYSPQDGYILASELPQKWPVLSSSIPTKTIIINTKNFTSLSEFIKSSKNSGLTHIVIDDKKNRPKFLTDVFYNEQKYPYLVKVFDSTIQDYKYNVKIFKIDYQKFESLKWAN